MNIKTKFLLLIISSLSFKINAQEIDFGKDLFFLLVNPDARSNAMGGFGISNSNSGNAIFNNFSLSPNLNHKGSLDISYLPTFRESDGRILSMSGVLKLGTKHSFGISARHANYGRIYFTDVNGNSTGYGNPFDYELSVAYGRILNGNFSIGIRTKYIFSNVATGQQILGIDIKSGKSLAADFSASYIERLNSDKDKLTLGLNVANFGSKLSYSDSSEGINIPFKIGIGGSYERNFSIKWKTILSIGYEYYFEDIELLEPIWAIGNELTYNNILSFRLGYERQKVNLNSRNIILIGAGFLIKSVSIQFAYQIYPESKIIFFDDHLNLNLGYRF